MSYSTLMLFKDRKVVDEIEYTNSHGTAPYVWGVLFDKYLKDPTILYDSWLFRCATGDTALWELNKREDLPDYERVVHAFTMDRAFVRKQDFPRFTAHIRKFLIAHPPDPTTICHWSAIADEVENQDCDAVGLYCTSLSDSPWYAQNDDEEERLVDIDGDDCFDVYKLLAGEYNE